MTDQIRLDRLNQGLGKLNTGGKQYIERLTSRLLQGSAPEPAADPVKTAKITTDPECQTLR